jgi:thioredoxin reductase
LKAAPLHVAVPQRNDIRIRECMKKGLVEVLFNFQPVEIRPDRVRLQVPGGHRELPNDFVWVLAGGTPPNAFLESSGVRLGRQELTEVAREGREVA